MGRKRENSGGPATHSPARAGAWKEERTEIRINIHTLVGDIPIMWRYGHISYHNAISESFIAASSSLKNENGVVALKCGKALD